MYAFKRRAVPAGTGPENMAPTTPNSTPSTPNATANAGTGHTQSTEGSSQKPTTEGPSHYKFDFEFPDKPEVGKEFPFPVPPEAIGAKNAQYSSPHVPHTTTTIPDSGDYLKLMYDCALRSTPLSSLKGDCMPYQLYAVMLLTHHDLLTYFKG